MAGINHERVVAHQDKGLAEDWNKDHKQKGNHDCEQHQFLNNVIENRTDFPAGPVEGQVIYRSDEHTFYHWNGTRWVSMVGPATVVVAADGSGDTTDIQDGIDMLPAGGGVVYAKEGVYTISSVIVFSTDNITIRGAGRSTIIYLANGSDVNCINVATADDINIESLQINGNKANQTTTVKGIDISAGSARCKVSDCYIHHCYKAGIYIQGDSGIVDRCDVDSNGNTGGSYEGGIILVSNVTRCNVTNNTCKNNIGEGISIANCDNNVIVTDNICSGNSEYGIALSTVLRAIINGNNCNTNDIAGIGGSLFYECAITANLCHANENGIVLVGNNDRNTITGNSVTWNDATGILINNANCDKNIVLGNIVYANTTAQITDNGTATVVEHNVVA